MVKLAEAPPAHAVAPSAAEHHAVPPPPAFVLADGGAPLAYRQTGGAGIAIVDPLSYAATIAGLEQAHGQKAFLKSLGAGHHLVYYDQRGSGASVPAGVPRDWQQRADDLWAVADAAGVERAVLYGVFDSGATIAFAAAQRPERVLGLIFNRVPAYFAAAAGDLTGSPVSALDDWFNISAGAPHGHAMHLMDAVSIPENDGEALVRTWEESVPAEVVARHAELLRAADLRPVLPTLDVPALVIATHRRPALAAWGEALGRLLPKACVVSPDSGAEALGSIHSFLTILSADVGRMASRLPAALSSTMSDTRRAMGAMRRIVVPVDTNVPAGRAVELACRLGDAQRAELVLAHVVVVPHVLPLDHPLPEATLRAERALMLGEAIAAEHGLPCRTVLLRERSAAGAIVRLASAEAADLIVMPLPERGADGADPIGRTAQEILRRSPCEVLIDRGSVR